MSCAKMGLKSLVVLGIYTECVSFFTKDNRNMVKIRIRELLVKKISATATSEELLELDSLFHKFPEYKEMERMISGLKTDIAATPDAGEIQSQLEEIWKKARLTDSTPSRPHFRLQLIRWAAVAAVLLAVITVALLRYESGHTARQNQSAQHYKTWKAPYGVTYRVTLPDGSTVKINSGTTLSYPVHFAADRREVKLEGEAYFEVTKNPRRPFLVHAGNLTVRVLGTAFNVKAYKDDQNVETTLIHGRIQVVMDDAPDRKILLSPNEKLTVSKRFSNTKAAHLPGALPYKLQTIATTATDINEIAWLDRKVAFTNESFGEVAKVIERKYNVKLVFQQEQLKNELITGVFETENLLRALHLLQMITDFDYELKGDKIILSNKK